MSRFILAGIAGVFSFAFGATLVFLLWYQASRMVDFRQDALLAFVFLGFTLVGIGLLLIIQESKSGH